MLPTYSHVHFRQSTLRLLHYTSQPSHHLLLPPLSSLLHIINLFTPTSATLLRFSMRKSRRVAGLPPGPVITFLSLPTEVRQTIYNYIFRGCKIASSEDQATLDSDDDEASDSSEQKYEKFVLVWHDGRHNVLLTCRQCHTEATALFYAMTTSEYRGSFFDGHPLIHETPTTSPRCNT